MSEVAVSILRNILCSTDRPRLSNGYGREIRRASGGLEAQGWVEVAEIEARCR